MSRITSQPILPPLQLLKASILIFLPISIILALLLGFFTHVKIQSEETVLASHEWSHLEIGQKSLHHVFENVFTTLHCLANSVVLKDFLNTGSDKSYADLSREYLTLMQATLLYDQARFISSDGMEVLRANLNEGQPHLVSQDLLQNKGHRYYFEEAFSLSQDEFFVSPLDLNIEYGQVEQPSKPMMRFATPVFDDQGEKRGIVLLNYLAGTILEHLQNVMSLSAHTDSDAEFAPDHSISSTPLLVNAQGYWLLGLQAEDEWGFMFNKRDKTMAARYPQAWKAMVAEDEGQVITEEGMFSFRSIYPLQIGCNAPDSGPYCWKLISFVPRTNLDQFYWYYIRSALLFYGLLLLLLAPVSFYLGRLRLLKQYAEESLHRYAFIVNKSLDPMTLIDDAYRYLAVSDSFCLLHGQKREDIIGKTVSSVWGTDAFISQIKPNLDRCLAGEVVSYSAWVTVPTLEKFFYDVTLSPFRDQNNLNPCAVVISRNISRRKRMEEELRSEKMAWEETFDAVPDLIAILDVNFQMTRVNRAMANVLGRLPEECVGRFCYHDVHGLTEPHADCPHVKLLADGKMHTAELVEDCLGGEFLVTVSPLHDNQGQVKGSVHIARDITESKRTGRRLEGLKNLKEALLQKEKLQNKLQLVTDAVVEIFEADFARIWLVESGDQCQTGCLHADPTQAIHTCVSHDSCLHLMASSGRYQHLNGKEHGRVPIGAYKIGQIASGDLKNFITNDVSHDPRVHDHDWARELGLQAFAGYCLSDQEGKPLGVLALFSKRNISGDEDAQLTAVANSTSQVIRTARAEEAMAESHTRLQTIIDNVDAMIYITDIKTYEILMINQYGRDLFGDVTGQKCWQAIQKDQDGPCPFCQAVGEYDRISAVKGQVWEVQNTRNLRWYECHDTRISWIDDRLVRLQILTDITERKETEEELQQYAMVQKTLLREVNHRVKNNLAAIIGMLYMEDERAEMKKVVNYRETLHELITRIQGLATVHSLLSASEWQPIALSYLCEEVAGASLSGLPPSKKIDLSIQCDGIYIEANQAHYLALVINELTTNSIKHALADRDHGKITIMVEKQDGDQLTLSFQDDGPGYPQAICDGDMSLVNIGMEIVEGITVSSLRGTVIFSNSGGAVTLISFTNECEHIGGEVHDGND